MSILLLMDDGPPFPRSLFASGEQGIWLDPSDFSTLFQDAAGTTPVTALGQPVGLALDKRLGLVLSANDFPVTTTTLTGWTVGANVTGVSSDGTGITFTGGGDIQFASTNWLRPTSSAAITRYAFYEIKIKARHISGAGDLQVGISYNKMRTITAASNGGVLTEYTVRGFADSAAWSSAFSVGAIAGGTWYIEDIRTYPIFGNHAYQTTSASRPTLQQDSNGLYYLSFDGTDDGMATPSINFTGTNKMTVWAGVRKLSDATIGIVAELSASLTSNAGTFYLAAPQGAGAATYAFASRGSIAVTNITAGATAPDTSVIVGVGDISGDIELIRRNGAQAGVSTADQGTGNYGNYPLYIGRRNNASLPFNGRIYQLIIRGAESNAGQIAATEAWCNAKTRAY